ncbi:hypothetical protein CDAR_439051 [Caerostris darwini]|uniref:Uncharacterized protein n=1 Tax=Caerostris darwini TaxID=1538125 RepID=A0AAV4MM65_9ARAC|nr:hypothetical protein CDAR_439051 [Caerostris darwini]
MEVKDSTESPEPQPITPPKYPVIKIPEMPETTSIPPSVIAYNQFGPLSHMETAATEASQPQWKHLPFFFIISNEMQLFKLNHQKPKDLSAKRTTDS